MLTLWTIRVVLLLAVVMVTAMMSSPAAADDKDKNDDPYKLPPLDSKEWKKQASGLEIWDVKEGKGDEVKKGETVTIHYTGWTLDGEIFDSSRKRGTKATFPLPNLIKGWQEGIPGMKAGGVRRLKIPGNLAYGEKGGAGGKIPPNATLVFEIELFEDPFKLPPEGQGVGEAAERHPHLGRGQGHGRRSQARRHGDDPLHRVDARRRNLRQQS